MIIHWHPEALEELNNTILYIKDNYGLVVASKVLDEIENDVNQLESFPKLWPIEFQKKETEYRVLYSKYNRIVYFTTNDSIEIVVFWNNRKDLKKLKKIIEN